MKVSLVALTRNEIDGVKEMMPRIPRKNVNEIIVVDGHSKDGTVEWLRKHRYRVVTQKKMGRGVAFLEGMAAAKGDVLIFFSPDGNEDPADIPRLIAKMKEGYDMVIASRFVRGGNSDDSDDFLYLRKFLNIFASTVLRIIWRTGVKDSINGYRAIRKEKMRELRLDAPQHEIEFQMTIRAAKLRHKMAEIPTKELLRAGGQRKARTRVMMTRFPLFFLRELVIGNKF